MPSGQVVNHGLEIAFYHGGKHARETHYVDGKREGTSTEWYPSGQKKLEGSYHNDLKDGPEIRLDRGRREVPGDELLRRRKSMDFVARWRDSEHQELEQHYAHDLLEGVERRWHSNGQLILERTWRQGLKDGPEKRWFVSGEPYLEAHHQAGKRDGLFREWFPSGKLKLEAHYKQGLLDGKVSSWFADGLAKHARPNIRGANSTAPEKNGIKASSTPLPPNCNWSTDNPKDCRPIGTKMARSEWR